MRVLTRTRLKEFLRGHHTRYSHNTVRLMYATLHVVLAEAAEDGLFPATPVQGSPGSSSSWGR